MNSAREEALFALALEKPAEKRAAFLDAMCEGDVDLRERLEALLAARSTRNIAGDAGQLWASEGRVTRVPMEKGRRKAIPFPARDTTAELNGRGSSPFSRGATIGARFQILQRSRVSSSVWCSLPSSLDGSAGSGAIPPERDCRPHFCPGFSRPGSLWRFRRHR